MSAQVVIRCYAYNHERYIKDALDGFVSQKTTFPFVAVVIDDHSSDKTAQIIREYENKYPDIIKGVYLQENHYQKGLSKDKYLEPFEKDAKYVAFCEGDDYWSDPTKLQRQWDALESDPTLSICVHKVRRVSKDKEDLGASFPNKNRFDKETRFTLDFLIQEEFLLGRWTFQTSSFFVRSHIPARKAELCKTIFKNYPYGDLPILLTSLIEGDGCYIPKDMSCYRVLSGGYMSAMRSNLDMALLHGQKKIEAAKDLKEFFKGRFDKEFNVHIKRVRYKSYNDIAKHRSKHYWLDPKYLYSRIGWLFLRIYGRLNAKIKL